VSKQRADRRWLAVPIAPVALGWVHIMSIAVLIAAAVVGIRLERPPIYAATALLIALFGFVIFVG